MGISKQTKSFQNYLYLLTIIIIAYPLTIIIFGDRLSITQKWNTSLSSTQLSSLTVVINTTINKQVIPEFIINEMISEVYHNKANSEYIEILQNEYKNGERDEYYLPKSYKTRIDNEHWSDIGWKDEYQKEVYIFAKNIMKYNKLNTVIDIGCGSGYKLVTYLSNNNYTTYGFETEPAISHLREKYPNQIWIDSGKPEETFNRIDDITNNVDECLVMAADVIEHIIDPNKLIDFMKSFKNCNLFLISTPNREQGMIYSGPPWNKYHVREWTFHEFVMYLSTHFNVTASYLGIQHKETQFHFLKRE